MKFVREQFFLAAAAQNIQRLTMPLGLTATVTGPSRLVAARPFPLYPKFLVPANVLIFPALLTITHAVGAVVADVEVAFLNLTHRAAVGVIASNAVA
jgi:hypothetical protein